MLKNKYVCVIMGLLVRDCHHMSACKSEQVEYLKANVMPKTLMPKKTLKCVYLYMQIRDDLSFKRTYRCGVNMCVQYIVYKCMLYVNAHLCHKSRKCVYVCVYTGCRLMLFAV